MIKKIAIIVGVIALVVFLFPGVKGAYYRVKHNVDDKLNEEFTVDNYKQLYIELHDKKVDCMESLQKFKVEQAVANRRAAYAVQQADILRSKLQEIGTSDPHAFARTREQYELTLAQIENFNNMNIAYSNAIAKLNQSLNLIKSNMSKSKMNIASLESKKECVDTLKAVNSIVEDINGVGNSDVTLSIEKLKDDELRESVKLETMLDTPSNENMSNQDIENYLKSL